MSRTLTGGVKRGKAPVTEDDVEARLHEEARRIDRDGYVVVVTYSTNNLLYFFFNPRNIRSLRNFHIEENIESLPSRLA